MSWFRRGKQVSDDGGAFASHTSTSEKRDYQTDYALAERARIEKLKAEKLERQLTKCTCGASKDEHREMVTWINGAYRSIYTGCSRTGCPVFLKEEDV